MTKPVTGIQTFSGVSPPWNLSFLDANLAALQAAINDVGTYGNYLLDGSGAANQITVNTAASVTFALVAGVIIQVKVANTNTSGTVAMTVNGGASTAIVGLGGAALIPGQLVAGAIYLLQYDGTSWQTINPVPFPRTAGEITAGVTPSNYGYPAYNVLRYAADNTATTDSLAAFQAAVNAAVAVNNNTITVPEGVYKVTGEIVIHQGVKLKGNGSQGATFNPPGCSILHYSNGNLFTWDGNGTAFNGTGGGLEHICLVKQTGFSGGNAINVVATDDSHRPGEMEFFDVLIFGTGTGKWAKCINVDGTACNTPGAKGVRDIGWFKVRVAGATTNDQYIHFNQAVHMHGAYIEVDTGNGTGTPGISFSGDGGPACIAGVEINGDIIIGDTCTDIHLQGRCGLNLTQAAHTSALGSFIGTVAGTITTVSPNFRVVSFATDLFEAFVNANVANVTGDGTIYTPLFNTTAFDQSVIYNAATGAATVNLAGIYRVDAAALLNSLGAAHTSANLDIVQKDAGGSVISVHSCTDNPGVSRNAANQFSFERGCYLTCHKGDVIHIEVSVSGSTKTVGIVGNATTRYSYFTMKYDA